MRIVVLVSGNGSNLQAILDACAAGDIEGEVVAVFSNRRAAYGLQRAREAGVPAVYLGFGAYRERGREAYDAELARQVARFRPEVVVLAGFMRIVTSVFIERFAKVINLHPALPGQLPGLHAIERAWAGRLSMPHTGVMVHEVVVEVDAGPVLGTTVVAFGASLQDLEERMRAAEHQLLVEVLAALAAPQRKSS